MKKLEIQGFELLEKLGEGGMGTVYKARQISLDRLVAIKVLPRHFAEFGDYAERFLIEAKIAASLKHNNIIQVYEAGKSGDDYYFVMELVSGYTIADWLERKGHLPPEDALLIIEFIADALCYTWEKAWIIHGDIKPANIMVDSDGTIKLADFLALTPPGGAERPESLKHNVVGTPNFMSPEQARGVGKLDFRTDIYSLGGVLYNLTTGFIPFWKDELPQEIMRHQIVDHIADPSELNHKLPKEYAWLIEKMMVKQASERYGSWNDVLQDIHHVKHGGMPLPPYPDKGASTVARSKERDRTVMRLPQDELAIQAGDDIEHKRQRSAMIRLLIYSLLGILFIFSGYYIYFGYVKSARHPVDKQRLEVSHDIPTEDQRGPPPPTPIPPPENNQGFVSPQSDPELIQRTIDEANRDPLADAGPQNAEELRSYTDLFEKIVSLVRYRKYSTAESLLQNWITDNEGNIYNERAQQDIERVQRINNMMNTIKQHPERVLGEPVRAKPRISGTLSDLSGDIATITRRTGQSNRAEVKVHLNKIYDVDLLRLIQKADPDHARMNDIIWNIAQAEYTDAANLLKRYHQSDGIALTRWNNQWQQMADNIQAFIAYEKIKQEVARNHFTEAGRILRAAEAHFADTDVFTWAYPEEIDQFRIRINAYEQQAFSSQPGKQHFIPERSHSAQTGSSLPDRLPEPQPVEIIQNSFDINNIDRYDIQDVKERFISLNNQIIRLRFRYRTDIKQINKSLYTTELGSESGEITVVFDKDAFEWMKDLPRWNNNSRRRHVYGKVEGTDGRLMLIGRRRDRHNGELTGEFVW